jgi:hypothetical protein
MIGETVGFAVPAAVGTLAYGLGVSAATTVLLAVAAGAGEGAILGLAQSRVLRREIGGFAPRDWIAATAAAAALAWAVGMPLGVFGEALPTPVLIASVAIAAVVLLTVIGGAQWLVLRLYVSRAELWVPANSLAWLLGLTVPFALMSLVDEGDPAVLIFAAGVASGLCMGLVVAAVTGLALVRLLRPGREAHPATAHARSKPSIDSCCWPVAPGAGGPLGNGREERALQARGDLAADRNPERFSRHEPDVHRDLER